jgi:hypothetical protein
MGRDEEEELDFPFSVQACSGKNQEKADLNGLKQIQNEKKICALMFSRQNFN